VLTPSHQFPLGGAMTPGRRLEFIEWAQDRNAWLVEDDYDSEFRYAGRPIPAMAGFDRLSRTIYVGSFSKIFSNSLRLGYAVVPAELLPAFRVMLEEFATKASLMPQQALANFIADGEFYRHLRRVRRIYGERRRFLLEALARNFAGAGTFTDHQAGMQVAFHLKGGADDREVARRARREGLTVAALSSYCFRPGRLNGLLLGFCGFTEEELEEGLKRLARVL
jgi:GntR family transcriptional regulator/MocR family aminotransferase